MPLTNTATKTPAAEFLAWCQVHGCPHTDSPTTLASYVMSHDVTRDQHRSIAKALKIPCNF